MSEHRHNCQIDVLNSADTAPAKTFVCRTSKDVGFCRQIFSEKANSSLLDEKKQKFFHQRNQNCQ